MYGVIKTLFKFVDLTKSNSAHTDQITEIEQSHDDWQIHPFPDAKPAK